MQDAEQSKEELAAEVLALRKEIESLRTQQEEQERKHLSTAETITGQIAHDFNNLLTPLIAYPALIRNDLPKDTLGWESLDLLEKAARNMVRITQRILALSSRKQQEKKPVCINDVIKDLLAEFECPANVQTHFEAAEGKLFMIGVDDRLKEAIRNLLLNGCEAMPNGGSLTLKTEMVALSAPANAQSQRVVPGNYIKIAVSDTGTGVAEEVRSRIFDPFVTTRKEQKGRGAGLGLSIVHNVVRDHRGYIDFKTEPGKGTVFVVYFPACVEEGELQSVESIAGGTESILIIDDDPNQIEVMEKVLGKLGYKVKGVRTGEDAVAHIKNNRVDLILLDIYLDPAMDGAETYRRIKEINPEQHAIIVSAFEDSERIQYAQSLGAAQFVKKMATVKTLGTAVRAELDKAVAQVTVDGGTGPLQILVVDDEEMIRQLFEMILSSAIPDAQIDTASNGVEAVKLFTEKHHALLVMDLNMPEMDGREAFENINAICDQNGWPMPPVIFCSGFSPPDSIKSVVGQGAIHCLLPKPVTEEQLLEEIKKRVTT